MEQDFITKELQKFNFTDAAISKMSSDYMPLTVKDLNDKEGYKQVSEARMIVKKKRVEVTNRGKELRADAVAYQKAIIEEEKRIVGLLEPIEEHLNTEKKKIDDEAARVKAEAEAREAARIQARINRLYGYGCRFDGISYRIYDQSIPHSILIGLDDKAFEEYCREIQVAVNKENARLAEIERLKKEEVEHLAKVAAEQAAERKRLDDITKKQIEEAIRIKAEQDAAAKKIKDEQEALEK
jgi:hypothetical protein